MIRQQCSLLHHFAYIVYRKDAFLYLQTQKDAITAIDILMDIISNISTANETFMPYHSASDIISHLREKQSFAELRAFLRDW